MARDAVFLTVSLRAIKYLVELGSIPSKKQEKRKENNQVKGSTGLPPGFGVSLQSPDVRKELRRRFLSPAASFTPVKNMFCY